MLISLGEQEITLEEAICQAMGYESTEPIHDLLQRYYREHDRYIQKVQPTDIISLARATHKFMDYPRPRMYEEGRRDFYDILLQRIKGGSLIANCVGFTAIYTLLMARKDAQTSIINPKGHVLSKVGDIFVENTASNGFDKSEVDISQPYAVHDIVSFVCLIANQPEFVATGKKIRKEISDNYEITKRL